MTEEARNVLDQLLDSSDVVLVAPLNWGLGHASRCVPLIRYIQQKCRKTIIAADGAALEFLSREFPQAKLETLPGYNMRYRSEGIVRNILGGAFSMIKAVILEHFQVKKLANKYGITVIISDNRLGCFLPKKRSFYLTHQTRLLHPVKWISASGTWLHQQFIKQFDGCLIPDFEKAECAIAPGLSHGDLPVKSYFIGPLSHLKLADYEKNWAVTVLLSGPEPQRTRLETALLAQIPQLFQDKVCIIRGTTNSGPRWPETYHVLDLASGSEVSEVLSRTQLLISRPGYSTIMDLYFQPINAIFIPTPGQTEQEYLASHLASGQRYSSLSQNEINNIQKTIKSLI